MSTIIGLHARSFVAIAWSDAALAKSASSPIVPDIAPHRRIHGPVCEHHAPVHDQSAIGEFMALLAWSVEAPRSI